jgi:hypothetical protein
VTTPFSLRLSMVVLAWRCDAFSRVRWGCATMKATVDDYVAILEKSKFGRNCCGCGVSHGAEVLHYAHINRCRKSKLSITEIVRRPVVPGSEKAFRDYYTKWNVFQRSLANCFLFCAACHAKYDKKGTPVMAVRYVSDIRVKICCNDDAGMISMFEIVLRVSYPSAASFRRDGGVGSRVHVPVKNGRGRPKKG